MPGGAASGADFEIFLACAPGLEPVLFEEVRGKGFRRPRAVPGGVAIRGGWPEVWRANLWVRGAGRVLARVASFRVTHLAQLDALARRVPWRRVLRPDVPVAVEASCAASRIWHSGAAAERVATAIHATLGVPASSGPTPGATPSGTEAATPAVTVMVRLEHDVCTLSVDTSGEPLHRRGHKAAMHAAPLRETLASLFLRQCGFTGDEPVLDPLCGGGTFVIEAAEVAARLNPGRSRRFAFERLAGFDPDAWARMRAASGARVPAVLCHGRDRDAGAIALSQANAARAGVAGHTEFRQGTVAELLPPPGPPGLVIANPPYGVRLGEAGALVALHGALGRVLRERFGGWRVGLLTAEPRLAHATALPFLPTTAPVPHGGLRVTLFRTAPLP